MSTKLKVGNQEITVYTDKQNEGDYISLTDMARFRDKEHTNYVIQNWMRTKYAIEFLGLWENLYNPNFKRVEFDTFRNMAGSNSFTLVPQRWIEKTGAIGIVSKSGRYGGTYAYKDIAFEFGSWLSPAFKLYLIEDYQRLKDEEYNRLKLEWDYRRFLSKVNYQIHTDAIQDHLIPPELTESQKNMIYAQEADMLNVAMFGMTAKEWREQHPDEKGSIRDYATFDQLLVLSNMESLNAELIRRGMPQGERLIFLNQTAIDQMRSLLNNPTLKRLR